MIPWEKPTWWRRSELAREHGELAKRAGEAIGYGIVPVHLALDLLHASVRALRGGPPEFPPFGRWKNCVYLDSMTRKMRWFADVASAEVHRQDTHARKIIGPALSRGARQADVLGLIKRECPELSDARMRKIVDEEAAWWVRHRHDLQQSAANQVDAELAAQEATWRAEDVRSDMEAVFDDL